MFNVYALRNIGQELVEMKNLFQLAKVIVLQITEPSLCNSKKG
jgi:hypothetical protein